jgi:hypothetical protein
VRAVVARDRVEEGEGKSGGGGACRGEAEEVGGEMGMGERCFFIFFVGLGDSKGRLGFGSAEGRALNRALALASERERTRATGGAHYRAPSRAL